MTDCAVIDIHTAIAQRVRALTDPAKIGAYAHSWAVDVRRAVAEHPMAPLMACLGLVADEDAGVREAARAAVVGRWSGFASEMIAAAA